MTQIRLSWSIGAPALKSITFSTFTDSISPAAPPPNYVVDPNWNGTFVDQEAMTFTFQNNIPSGETFNIYVDFQGSGGCTSTVSTLYFFP
jgi:hypothetical protein